MFNRNNGVKKQYEAAVEEALAGKLGIDELQDKISMAQIIVITLFKEQSGAQINLKRNGEILPLKFEVVNGMPDITRYKLISANEDRISSSAYSTIHAITGMDGRGVIESFKSDLIMVEDIITEALEAAYKDQLEFIYSQGISYIYPSDASSEGPLVITGFVDDNDEVIFKYATTSSINLTFKDDWSKVKRV